MTAPSQPKTLYSFRIMTQKGGEKLTPWFDDFTDLVEYIEETGGEYVNKYARKGGDMYEIVAGEEMTL